MTSAQGKHNDHDHDDYSQSDQRGPYRELPDEINTKCVRQRKEENGLEENMEWHIRGIVTSSDPGQAQRNVISNECLLPFDPL